MVKTKLEPKGILNRQPTNNCMSSNSDQQAYDRGVSVFSPEGRIYQVEYAREAVENGSPTVGVRAENGVVLAALTSPTSPLALSTTKLHRIEGSIGAATTGYVPDGRRLVDDLRVGTQQQRLRYGEQPDVEAVSKQVADKLQESTQVGGRRPFGSSLIIGGVDDTGPRLFAVEPGGTPREWMAVADGNRREEYIRFFEDNYTEDISLEEAEELAVEAFSEVSQEEVSSDTVSLATVDTETETFNLHDDVDVQQYTGE